MTSKDTACPADVHEAGVMRAVQPLHFPLWVFWNASSRYLPCFWLSSGHSILLSIEESLGEGLGDLN